MKLIRQGQSFSGNERNCVFLNTGKPRFADVSFVSGLDFPDDARAAAYVDWDHDGDLDFWFANRNAPQVRYLQNQYSSGHHFLSLRLRGTASNRDAIGARVEVTTTADQKPIVRTLRAGSGYLTQSSKWMHIGLATHDVVSDVTVRWPGGQAQSFGSLAGDKKYLLEESGEATEWKLQRENVSLKSGNLISVESSDRANIYSTTRLPVPRLDYETKKGQVLPIETPRPTLIVLWASWCQPCIEELASLEEARGELNSSGVRVLALSVDKLDAAAGNTTLAAEILNRIGFSQESGFATAESVTKLQMVNDFLFLLQKPLPVPTSFLMDQDYQLVSLYRGQLDAQAVLRDVSRLELSQEQRRDASIPFGGRWIGKPKNMLLAPFVVELAQAGFVVEASELVQRVQNQFDPDTILDLVVRLGIAYYDRGMRDHADLHFRMARKIRPQTPLPEVKLAEHLTGRRKYIEAYRTLIELNRRNSRSDLARVELAWFLATCPDETIRNAKRAEAMVRPMLAASPRATRLYDVLGASLASQGDFSGAVKVTTQGVNLATAQKRFRQASEMQQRVQMYHARSPFVLP